MRKKLNDLVKSTIAYQYTLPHNMKKIPKTIFTTETDKCYKNDNLENLVKIIYNLIIDYSFNEFDIDKKDYQKLITLALKTKLKYHDYQNENIKLKYGFYGEVLLYAMIHLHFGTQPLIARGYFYIPLEDAETKGYDSFHLIEHNNKLELWFGEVKFHKSYHSAVTDIVKNIDKAISDGYLEKNLLTIFNQKSNLNMNGTKISDLFSELEENPEIQLIDFLSHHNIKLVYPILIIYENTFGDYDNNINKVIKHINKKYSSKKFDLSIDYSIFFMFVPIENVKKVKTEVIKWIEEKQQVIL